MGESGRGWVYVCLYKLIQNEVIQVIFLKRITLITLPFLGGQISLGRGPCRMGTESHKIQVGPDRLRKASTSTPIERLSGQIGFGRGPT